MKYAGMPMGMWVLFAGSFQKQLTAVLGYDAATARAITKKAKPQYRQIIAGLPEFEKADRFKMNLVNCAMVGAFILSMPQRPEVDRLTDYYAKAIQRFKTACGMSGDLSCSLTSFSSERSSAVQRWHQSAGWDVWRCLAGDCSHGASVILGGTGSAVWHLAQ